MIRTVSVQEASKIMGVCRQTIYKLIEQNELVAKKIGNKWRILYESIEEFLNSDKLLIENFFRK